MKLFLFLCLFLPLAATEHHPHLSYAQQTLHILSGYEIKDAVPVDQIIFLHIPKTAGTNLTNIANAVSRMTGQFHYQRLPVPRRIDRSPNLITSGWMGGLQPLENNPNLLSKIPHRFFLAGHFPYGLHLYFSKPSKYITLIRHPLAREFSDANFAYQRGYIQKERFASYLLEEMIDNPQVRLIAGKESMTGPCTQETLDKAKENIERDFLLAAPIEDVDDFIEILASIQGWGSLAYAPMQITREKAAETPSPLLSDALIEKHKWDLQFYEWIQTRWYEWKKQAIFAHKSPDARILTLMPDFLTNRQTVFLSLEEINSYNQSHSASEFIELNQN